MSQQRNAEVERLFSELIDLEPAARAIRLRELALAPTLSDEIASLLAADQRAGDFLGLRRATSDRERGHREPGRLIAARYRLERHLDSGAMGDVYLAWDQQLERSVALKFLRTSTEIDLSGHPRFFAEARAAARLDHPNVATVHDIGATDGRELFIAMAYYPGETLRDRIARGPLSTSDALRIAGQIAAALSAAHAAGVIHCDVKPANVLFDAEEVVKLADFGVAKLLTDHESTSTGTSVGTVAYMSPEQARGDTVDSRTDLWSLGVVLYEMIAGRRPFVGENLGAVLQALMNNQPMPFAIGDAQPNSATHTFITTLLATLLAKDPAQRPSSATVVCNALLQFAEGDDALSTAPSVVAGTLPYAVTSFIGRERELDLALRLLQETRLLTLTGPGGIGKTRLALQLAADRRASYPGGTWFVPLAEISDPDLVPSMIAQALALRDLGGALLSDRVIAALRNRHVLLIMDNFEHVLDGGKFVAALLAACPGVSVVVTSRTPLAVQGEQELPVPRLTTPAHSDADAGDTEAVRLFVQRARAVRPNFELTPETLGTVAEICRRLDGLPLALELAAARAKLLSPRAMLARLEHRFDLLRADTHDRPLRHSTMRDVIDWSYALLTDTERALFGQLAVFAGGVSVEAAEAIAPTDQNRAESTFAVLDVLGSLCNKSLLQNEEQPDGEPRFTMLETVREFSLDRLRATGGEAAARSAHRAYYLSLAEGASAQLRGPAQTAWFDRLESEYANCRIALEDALNDAVAGSDSGLADAARLAVSLHRLWFTRGPLLEGVDYLRRIIAAADTAAHNPLVPGLATRLRAQLLTGAAQLANTRSIFPEARDLFARSLALHRKAGDRTGIATTLNNLAWTEWLIGDLTAGEEMSTSAMAMHRELGDELGISLSLNNLAWIAMERGQYSRAEDLFTKVLASHGERGDRRSIAFSTGFLGLIVARRGDFARAITLHQLAIEMLEPVADRGYRMLCFVRLAVARHAAGEPGDHAGLIETRYLAELRDEGRLWPIAFALTELGAILRDNGELARARDTLIEALEVRRQTGALQGVAEARLVLGSVYHREGDRARAADLLAQALGEARDFGSVPIVIDCIEAIAALSLDNNRPDHAAQLFAAAAHARDAMGAPFAPRYGPEREQLRRVLAKALGDKLVACALAQGTVMTVHEATAIALGAAGALRKAHTAPP